MNKTILVATMLVLGAVAVAPTASADHVVCPPEVDLPEIVCTVAESHGIEIVECYYNTPPRDWLTDCP